MPTIKISIPTPCTQNWQQMDPNDQGRYCAACQKCVVDFSAYSDKQLADYFNATQGKVCGRFRPGQLNRVLDMNQLSGRRSPGLFPSMLFLSILGVHPEARENLKWPLMYAHEGQQHPTQQRLESGTKNHTSFQGRIKGIVYDSDGKTPLPFVSICIKDTKIGTQTDNNGAFELLIPAENERPETVISITYTGYETREFALSSIPDENWEVVLSSGVLVGEILVIMKPTIWDKLMRPFRKKRRYH